MQHPSHSLHHLTLMPFTTYSATYFICNACSAPGNAFSDCCALCDFDLHVDCASLPGTVKFEVHPHELSLSYGLQHNEASPPPHSCEICHKVLDSKFWTYSCAACNFNAHTCCATGKIREAAACQEPEKMFGGGGDHRQPAMGHHGFHDNEDNAFIRNQTMPTSSSGRPFIKPHCALLAQHFARVNASLDILGSIG